MRDVIILGGGVCGCSLLYELSRYAVDCLLLEKENDLACGTTKANSGIVHAGYDPEPGTAMARFNVAGNALIETRCAELDIPYRKTGSLVVGFDGADRRGIERLLEKGRANGVPDLRIIEGEALFALEPQLNPAAVCALYAPSAAIVCPWELALAQAECAAEGGAEIALDCEVRGLAKTAEGFEVTTDRGVFSARYVVNAAGIDADTISAMLEQRRFAITPKSGEYFILDTAEGGLVNTVLFPCPSKQGKGVLVAPTVHGNIIAGPDSKDWQRGDFSTSAAGLAAVRENAQRLVPSINFRASIRNFAGLRAEAGQGDFIVGESPDAPGFFNIAGIKSPGLSSAPAIALEIVRLLREKGGLDFSANPRFVGKRRMTRFKELDEAEKHRLIQQNPRYGTIVCRCETVTEGEIEAALNRPLPPRSIDALKRRLRPGMGRCQGGFCGPKALELIARRFGLPPEDVPKDRAGTYIITGRTKGGV